jgi:NADPH-dependent 2,4-dienoyl-CoA reductase/sulfur reductase-like enzyme
MTITNVRVAIVGGGSAGISVASKLMRHKYTLMTKNMASDKIPISIIDPSNVHYYQPLWTLVGGGVSPFEESKKLMEDVVSGIPVEKGQIKPCLISDKVTKVFPTENKIQLASGNSIKYDYLLMTSGLECKFDAIPGLKDCLGKEEFMVTSNYSPDSVQRTFEFIKKFKGGTAIFTQPSTPIKCAGAPQKIMYLAEEYWREHGVEAKTIFKQGMPSIFAVKKYAESLTNICKERNIQVDLSQALISIDGKKKEAIFSKKDKDGAQVEVKEQFDFIHVSPPMGPPSFIKESGLANDGGWCLVNNSSLQSPLFGNVFSLGDCSSVPVSKTASAVAAQSVIAAENLSKQIQMDLVENVDPGKGKVQDMRSYDGYTACPLVTGKNKLIMAEFNGFTLDPKETFWFDQSKESSLMFHVKKSLLPAIYWNLMLKGDWDGPLPYRKYLNPRST